MDKKQTKQIHKRIVKILNNLHKQIVIDIKAKGRLANNSSLTKK